VTTRLGTGKLLTFFYSERYFTDHLGVLGIISSLAERIRIRSSEAKCPRNEKKNFSDQTETNRNKLKQDLFCLCSVCFMKPNTKNFSLFRFVSVCFGVSNLY
jgi:hypothetical protein